MRIAMIIIESLELKDVSLPFENPMMQALKTYARRLAVFLLVICANFVILGAVIVIANLKSSGSIRTITSLGPLLWLLAALLPLVVLQRLLHREMQAGLLITTRNAPLTIGLFSLLFFPGVLLHELSHFIMAKLLRVSTAGFSIIPRALPNGRLQLGYVETEKSDRMRDLLIGLAPLIVGSLFVAYAAIYQMQLLPLWDLLRVAQWESLWAALKTLPSLPFFWLWFYLTFTVSSTMMPSASDRHPWSSLGLLATVFLALAILASAGAWMMENLAPSINAFLRALALTFGLSGIIHSILIPPILLLHRMLTKLTGLDAK